MNNNKVLVVDDSSSYLQFTVRALERAGYQVLTSDNAWITNIVSRERPDLILMDVQLGAVSGTDAVNILRKRSFCKDTIILLHTAGEKDKLDAMSAACGAHGYVIKDGKPETLLDSMSRYIGSKQSSIH